MEKTCNKRLLVIVGYHFPNGEAGSGRMLNFCRLFASIGYSVHVVAAYTKNKEMEVNKKYMIDNISYEVATLEEPKSIDSFFGNKAFFSAIKRNLLLKYDIVFTSSLNELFLKIAPLCKKNGSKLYVEQCEWMDITSYKFGKFDMRYLRVNYLRKKGYKQADGIISISRLLDDYYNTLGMKSIRIPTILSIDNNGIPIVHNYTKGKIHLLFAGSLGASKELLAPVISAIASYDIFINTFVLDIYGPSMSQIKKNINDDQLFDLARSFMIVHERVSQEKMSDIFKEADYLIFVRPERKSSNAGFPTKLAESMAVGTPVITNNTGDISLYLRDKINGFILKGNNAKDVIRVLEEIRNLKSDQYLNMRNQARKEAECSFNLLSYQDLVKKFL